MTQELFWNIKKNCNTSTLLHTPINSRLEISLEWMITDSPFEVKSGPGALLGTPSCRICRRMRLSTVPLSWTSAIYCRVLVKKCPGCLFKSVVIHCTCHQIQSSSCYLFRDMLLVCIEGVQWVTQTLNFFTPACVQWSTL